MPTKVFKCDIPASVERELIGLGRRDETGKVIFDKPSFKSARLKGLLYPFFGILQDYYHASTKHYVSEEPTYSRYLTIVRQILVNRNICFSNSYVNVKHTRYAVITVCS